MITPRRIISGSQLTNVVASYYAAPANTTTIITKLTITNTSAGAVTVTIYIVPAGGGANASSTLTITKSIGPKTTVIITEAERHVLGTGDSIQAVASAGGDLTIIASGAEIV